MDSNTRGDRLRRNALGGTINFQTIKSIIMSAQKVLVGALSGLVAGVAIGVLMAPAEGSETRQKIADTAESFKKKLRKLRGITSDELDELTDIFEKETDGLKDDVRR